MPHVSVCIPTYNGARYLAQTIESVLAQSFEDFELVVCDDASKDETASLCTQYEDKRFRYLRFNQNLGQAGNFNRCLAEARGELLTLLHADDYLLPGFLADRLQHFRIHQAVGFVFGAFRRVDAKDELLSIEASWTDDRQLTQREILEALLKASVVCPASLMVRRSTVARAGAFRTDLTWGHDWDWAIRLAQAGGAFFCAEPLAAYRVHDASGTAELLAAARNGEQESLILEEAFERVLMIDPSFKSIRRDCFRALGLRHVYYSECALLARRPNVARYNLLYAGRADPSLWLKPSVWAILVASHTNLGLYSGFKRMRNILAKS